MRGCVCCRSPLFVKDSPAGAPPTAPRLVSYDAYHLFHNMVTLVIFGSDSGDVLNQKNIRAAAEATGDFLLISVANAKVDKHSHMATHFFLTSNALTAELRLRGHFQDAVVLETFGRASIAWLRPGRTEEWRTKALHACNLLLFRIMGRAMHDVAAIRATKKRAMGFTINQLMDLLANNEARIRWLRTLSASERSAAKETALTTRYVESFFSKLMANKGSGEKMTQNEIQGVVCKLDALLLLMRTAGNGSRLQRAAGSESLSRVPTPTGTMALSTMTRVHSSATTSLGSMTSPRKRQPGSRWGCATTLRRIFSMVCGRVLRATSRGVPRSVSTTRSSRRKARASVSSHAAGRCIRKKGILVGRQARAFRWKFGGGGPLPLFKSVSIYNKSPGDCTFWFRIIAILGRRWITPPISLI